MHFRKLKEAKILILTDMRIGGDSLWRREQLQPESTPTWVPQATETRLSTCDPIRSSQGLFFRTSIFPSLLILLLFLLVTMLMFYEDYFLNHREGTEEAKATAMFHTVSFHFFLENEKGLDAMTENSSFRSLWRLRFIR